MQAFVDFVLGDVVYLNPEGIIRIVGLAVILEFIAMFGRAYKF